MMKKVLIACEESQRVCIEFRKLNFVAYSCDIIDCSGQHPEWHIKQDVLPLLDGNCVFKTCDNKEHYIKKWDLIIAHPPCTYLSNAGARFLYPKKGELNKERFQKGLEAKSFFMKIYNCDCEHIAIENPTYSKVYDLPKHSQVIQPYQFGEPFSKRTLLWLKNLPILKSTCKVQEFQPFCPSNTSAFSKGKGGGSKGVAKAAKERSKTFQGIAKAMAEQWGGYIKE